jgi:hypothetical protein
MCCWASKTSCHPIAQNVFKETSLRKQRNMSYNVNKENASLAFSQADHDRHHIYRETLSAAAMASTGELRDDAIAQQRAKLVQNKAAFTTAISEILDAMDHPDDPKGIIDVIAHSFAKAHLRDAMEAAIAIKCMTRQDPASA